MSLDIKIIKLLQHYTVVAPIQKPQYTLPLEVKAGILAGETDEGHGRDVTD
jgi:hypothetical protein